MERTEGNYQIFILSWRSSSCFSFSKLYLISIVSKQYKLLFQAQLDSVQHQRELQQKTNELLHKYYTNLPFSRKYQHHHAALQARIEIDLDLMLSKSNLSLINFPPTTFLNNEQQDIHINPALITISKSLFNLLS